MKYGLAEETIAKISDILARHPRVEKAILYGSRAKGNYKNGSDIDMTIQGAGMDGSELARIEDELDELLLPYSFDLSIYSHIDNSDLLAHIDRVGVELYIKD